VLYCEGLETEEWSSKSAWTERQGKKWSSPSLPITPPFSSQSCCWR